MRLAAVQDSPIFLDLAASTAKAVELIERAGRDGADVIGFPEGFLPGHPGWAELHPFDDLFIDLNTRLFANAVEIDSPTVQALQTACEQAEVAAVVGVCERSAGSTGTLFNTLLYIDEHGRLAERHQKYVPTIGERLVHGPGTTGSVNSFTAQNITVSGLICGENSNPLAQYAAAVAYPTVHIASWPPHFSPGLAMEPVIDLVSRGLAYSLKCFVINAVGIITPEMVDAYGNNGQSEYLRCDAAGGLASIISPTGRTLAQAHDSTAQLVYADIDISDVIGPKFIHDVAGHYNRPELFVHLFNS